MLQLHNTLFSFFFKCILTSLPRILGEEAWTTLISLPFTLDNLRHTRVVTADVISKNGFKIEICLGILLYILMRNLPHD